MDDSQVNDVRRRTKTLEKQLANLREELRRIAEEQDWDAAVRDLRRALEPSGAAPHGAATQDDHDFRFIDEMVEWITRPLRDE